MRNMYILQGIPGSGKSTRAAEIARLFKPADSVILSTDSNFYDARGRFRFDPTKLDLYHARTQMLAQAAAEQGLACIIVDNCNIKRAHAAPYIRIGLRHSYRVHVIRLECSPEEAARRCARRADGKNIPPATVHRMFRELEAIEVADVASDRGDAA